MYGDCMSMNRRKVSEFRTTKSDKHNRHSRSLEVLDIDVFDGSMSSTLNI